MIEKAYLLVLIEGGIDPPRVVEASIMSEPHPTIVGGMKRAWALLYECANAQGFGAAREDVLRVARGYYPWVVKYLRG